MKYKILFVCLFFQSCVFAQKATLREFFLGDPSLTKKGEFTIPSPALSNIIFNEGLAAVKITDTLHGVYTTKIGFINKKGKLIIPAKYDTLVSQFQIGIYKIKWATVGIKNDMNQDVSLGVINDKGEVLIDFYFKEVGSLNYNKVPVKYQNGYWGFINVINADKFFSEEKLYKNIEIVSGGNFRVEDFNKWRVYSSKGEFSDFYADSLIVFDKEFYKFFLNGKYGIVQQYNIDWLFNMYSVYDEMGKIINGNFIVKKGNKFGVLSVDDLLPFKGHEPDNFLVPVEYDSIFLDASDFIYVKKNGKWGAFNKNGDPFTYQEFSLMKERFTKSREIEINSEFYNQYKVGLYSIDSIGELKFLFPADKYSWIEKLDQRFIEVREKGKYGVLNKLGKSIVPAEYDSIYFSHGDSVFVVFKGKKMGIIDHDGTMFVEPDERFQKFMGFVEGRARIIKAGKFGYIDRRGNIRIAPQYIKAEDFSEGLAAVLINGKWGFVDKDENIVVQPYYSEVKPFRNGVALAKVLGKWYMVNKEGKKINSSPYDEILAVDYNKWLLVKNNKYGLADENGRELIVPRYDLAEDFDGGFVKVKKDGKYGVLDYNGNFIVPIEYDDVIYNPWQKLFIVMVKGTEEMIEIK